MKYKFLLVLMGVTTFSVLFVVEKFSYPVVYKVCNITYEDCQVIAKFKNREDCEITNKKWGWYCDQIDKSNIKCREKESDISTGFCD